MSLRGITKSALDSIAAHVPCEDGFRHLLGTCSFFPTFRNEHHAVRVMLRSLQPDSCCVDVGAHAGSMLKHMVRIAPQGRHVAFEPLPDLYMRLCWHYRPRGVEIHDVALGEKSGTRDFYRFVDDPGLSGLHPRMSRDQGMRVSPLTVELRTLDEMIRPASRVDLIKLDVEGYELQVLKGAVRTITRWNPLIIFEHHLHGAPYFDTTPAELYDFVKSGLGMHISCLDRWLHGFPPMSLGEFEAEVSGMRNKDFIAHSRR